MANPAGAVAVHAGDTADIRLAAGGARAAASNALWRRAVQLAVQGTDFGLLVSIHAALAHGVSDAGLFAAPLGWAAPWVAAPFIAAAMLRAAGAYRFAAHETGGSHAASVACAALAAAGVTALLAWIMSAPAGAVLTAGVLSACILTLTHEGWRRLMRSLAHNGHFARNVVIVGATPNAERLIETNARTGDVNVMGVFDERVGRTPGHVAGAPVLGTLDDLFAWPDLPRADCIIITVTSLAVERTRALIERLRPLPNKIALFLDLETFRPETANLARVADLPVAYISGRPDALARLISKRAQDIVLALIAVIAFAPVMIVVALAIKVDSPGPVFFRQRRHGFNNSIIHVLKFRTMRADVSGQPTRQVVPGDSRVTRLGRILRRTSLDELPQFFNVMSGQMSMVGPRPHAIDMKTGEVETARLVADYAHRCRVKPGITGWAQIHGSRGPVHTAEEVERRVRYDVDYIQRQSLLLDLWILLCTVPCFLGDSLRTR